MRRIFLTLAFLVLAGTLIFIGYLGYFNDPEMKTITAPSYTITGKYFEGSMKDKSFGRLFDEADSLILKEGIQGTTALFLDENPVKVTDTMKAFVGVILADTSLPAPEGFSKRTIPSRRVLQAEMTGSFLLLPTNIYEKISEYARENVLDISTDSALEIYASEKKLVVQVPVR